MSSDYLIIIFLVVDCVLVVYSYLYYFRKLNAKKSEIIEAVARLQEYSVRDYSARFEDINKLLLKNETVSGMWCDYRQNLTRRKNSDGIDELYAPVEAGEFFRYNFAVKDINTAFWQNFGGIFTGVGIFGTFLGLVIGLRGVDLSSSDVAVLKEGIGSLLSGISIAFGTSLAGIFLALVYGYLNKSKQDALSKAISSLAEKISEMYPCKTVEQWLADEHRESEEQTKAIKNLSQDMAETLGELLDQQLSDNFNELCKKLDEQMKPVFEKLYDAISSLNEGGATAIAGAVNERAGAQLNAFADILEKLQETMQRGLENSEKTSTQANTMMIETMKQIAASLQQGTDDAIKKQHEAANRMGEQMQTLIAAFNQSSEQAMNNMLAASDAAQMEVSNSVAQNKVYAQDIITAVQEMAKRQSVVLEESINSNKQKIDETVASMQSTFKENNETLGQAYADVKAMSKTVEDLLEKLETASASMESSVAPITEATNSLSQQLKVVREHTDRLHEETVRQIERLAIQGSQTEKSLTRMSEAVTEAENKAVAAWNTYNEGLNGIGDELEKVFNSIAENMAQYNTEMNDGMKKQLNAFDNSAAEVATQLKTVVDELNDLVEDLNTSNKDRM